MSEAKSKTPGLDAEGNSTVTAVEPVDLTALDLATALDLEFEGWLPEPGDKLTGTVVATGETDGGHPEFGAYPILSVVADDGRLVAVHAFHTNLRNEIERQNPGRGDRIGIKYKGRKETGGQMGTGYEAYNVIVVPGAIAQAATALPA